MARRPPGPSNLSVNSAEAVQLVLGNSSKCAKSPWYSRSLPLVSLHTVRDKKDHDARRRVFSRAFSPAALNEYEKRVHVHCEQFVAQMKRRAGRPFDASDWFKYFGRTMRPCQVGIVPADTAQRLMSWAMWDWARSFT
jgi:tryprostatin B 6-hydroxylase